MRHKFAKPLTTASCTGMYDSFPINISLNTIIKCYVCRKWPTEA